MRKFGDLKNDLGVGRPKRLLALMLAVVMLSSVFAMQAFSNPDYVDGINMENAMHFIIRHWHTVDPGTKSSASGGREGEASTENTHFVVFEGYVRPSGSTYELYLYEEDDGNKSLHKVSNTEFRNNEYLENWNASKGSFDVIAVPAKDIDGTVIEKFAGFSLSTGRSQIDTDRANARATIAYNQDYHLVKMHFFYASTQKEEGKNFNEEKPTDWNGSPERDTVGTGDDKVYNTSLGLHTDKTASVHQYYDEEAKAWKYSDDGRTFDLKLEAWYNEGNIPDVGLVLDASGSMAFTAEKPKAIHIDDMLAKKVITKTQRDTLWNLRKATAATSWNFLSDTQLGWLLDSTKTDNTRLGESGYSYYVYDSRTSNAEFAALGYVTRSKAYKANNLYAFGGKNGDKPIGALDRDSYQTPGWFYVNHSDKWAFYDTDNDNYSGKMHIGMRYSHSTLYKDSIALPPGYTQGTDRDKGELPGGGTGAVYNYTAPSTDIPPLNKFYIDKEGFLRCFFATSSNSDDCYVCSYVYEYDDGEYTKAEALQRALGSFTTKFLERSPDSFVSATRFSTKEVATNSVYDKLVMLDWTQNSQEAAGIMSLKRGTNPYGTDIGRTIDGTPSANGLMQYNYGLTGNTSTRTGLWSFGSYLANVKVANAAKVNNNSLAPGSGRDKYLIVFTDGKDTDYYTSNSGAYKDDAENAVTYAEKLRAAGYTIYAVMLTGGPVSKGHPDYDTSRVFLAKLTGDEAKNYNGDGTGKTYSKVFITDEIKEKYDKEHENDDDPKEFNAVDALQSIFTDEILPEILHRLKDYNVQDYIDPRFDLVASTGRQWHLNADGAVVVTNEDGTKYSSYNLKSGAWEYYDGKTHSLKPVKDDDGKYYLTITLTDRKTVDDQKARLYYDSAKDMYYLVWTEQNIPATPEGEESPTVWSGMVTVRAKDDFIGGNAVLSNGNGKGENYVYYPGDKVKTSSGTDDMYKTESDKYPSKGFPRTTVDVKYIDEDGTLHSPFYMNEDISPDTIKDKLREWNVSEDVIYYWEYLERYARYFYNDANNVFGKTYSDYEGLYADMIKTIMEDGELDLPYYYLPDGNKSNQTGGRAAGDLHEKDCLGTMTYKWEDKYTGPKNNTSDFEFADIFVTYTPKTEAQRESGGYNADNAKLVGENAYKWDKGYKDEVGTETSGNTISGTYDAEVVPGEIMLQMELDINELKKAKELDSGLIGKEIKYSADLYREYLCDAPTGFAEPQNFDTAGGDQEIKPDGTEVRTLSDGTVLTRLTDGTVIEKRTDGTELKKLPEGEVINSMPDGKVYTKAADGSYTKKEKVGTYTATYTYNGDENETVTVKADMNFVYGYMVEYGLPIGTYTLVPNGGTNSGSDFLAFTNMESVTITEDDHGGLFTNNGLHTANDGKTQWEDPASYPAPTDGVNTAYLGTNAAKGTNYLEDLFALFKVGIKAIMPGSLQVGKQVNGYNESMKNDTFTFTVTLDTATLNTDVIRANRSKDGGAGSAVSIDWKRNENENGVCYVGEFTLKHNEVITIEGLPGDTKYTVKETNANGYDLTGVSVENAKGKAKAVDNSYGKGTIVANETTGNDNMHSWTFTNTPFGSIAVKKVVDKTGRTTDKKFKFKITLLSLPEGYELSDINKNGVTWTKTGESYTTTIEVKDGETVTVGNIPVGAEYTIEEIEDKYGYELKNVTGDGSVDDSKIASGDIGAKDEKDSWTFTNFKPKKFGRLEIEKKAVNGYGIPITDETFDFTVTLTLPEGYDIADVQNTGITWTKTGESYTATVKVKAGEKVTINNIPVETEYTIVETGKDGYELTKVEKDGSNVASKISSGTIDEENKKYTWTFTNTKEKRYGAIEVKKEIAVEDDDEPSDTDEFEFEIRLTLPSGCTDVPDDDFTFTPSGIEIEWEQESDGTWVGTFKLTHNQSIKIGNIPEGTTYTIKETDTGEYILRDAELSKTDKNGNAITEEPDTDDSTDDPDADADAGDTGKETVEADTSHNWTFTNAKSNKFGSIEVKKLIVGDITDDSFEFTVTLKLPRIAKVDDPDDYFIVTGYGSDGNEDDSITVTWTQGQETGEWVGTVELKHGQSVRIENIPEGTTYTIEETDSGIYRLQSVEPQSADINGTVMGDGTAVQYYAAGTIEEDTNHQWTFKNHPPFKLPETGGAGVALMGILGVLLIAAAAVIFRKTRKIG